jgi:hypothetical protein
MPRNDYMRTACDHYVGVADNRGIRPSSDGQTVTFGLPVTQPRLAKTIGLLIGRATPVGHAPSGVSVATLFSGLARTLPLEFRQAYARHASSNAPFPEPSWNMDHEIVNKTPYRRQHSPRRRVNQVQNILRARLFRQHSFNKSFL